MKRFFKWCGLVTAFLAVAAGLTALEILSRLSPITSESKKIVIKVRRGAAAPEIARVLEKAGVIRSAEIFRYYVAFKGLGPQIKAGEHVLDPSLSVPKILDALIKGRYKLYRLTVPEGLTMVQIASLVEESGLADKDRFLELCRDPEFIAELGLEVKTLEGYLFPETYHFVRGASTRDIIKAMVGRFQQVWEGYQPQAEGLKLTRHEIVTLASIVEKETGAAHERPMIAAVFLNRLKRGMRLETDPTVIYGLENFDGNLTRKDLETPTPYNTYRIDGLPPGPIANPGEESLRAVIEPASVDYLYFVSKNDGTHEFSRSLAEHNRAVYQYQKLPSRR